MGRSHLLLRDNPKIERQLKDQEEIKEYKQKSDKYKSKIGNLKLEITKLKDMLNQKEKNSAQYDKYADLLGELFNKGIIVHEGSFINKDK